LPASLPLRPLRHPGFGVGPLSPLGQRSRQAGLTHLAPSSVEPCTLSVER